MPTPELTWRFKGDWPTNPRNPNYGDLRAIALDQGRKGEGSWGGPIDGGGYDLSNWADNGGQLFNVRAFGAKGDGITDDTAAINYALSTLVTGGLLYFPMGTYLISGTLTVLSDHIRVVGAGSELVTIKVAPSSNLSSVIDVSGRVGFVIEDVGFFGNFINQTHSSATLNTCINGSTSIGLRVKHCKFRAFGNTSNYAYAQVISLYSSVDTKIQSCLFLSNLAHEINMNGARSVTIHGSTFGSPLLTDSQSHVDWWDTRSGGFGTICIGCSDVTYSDNVTYGVSRAHDLTAYGYGISSGGGLVQGYNVRVINNKFYGLGNSRGMLAVTSGSGTIVGTNTAFTSIDIGRHLVIEGDSTTYKVTGYTSPTQITVTPVVARSTAAGLRHQFQNSGDVYSVGPVVDYTVSGNEIYDSGDMAIDVSGANLSTSRITVSNNKIIRPQICGLYIGGNVFGGVINGNMFYNCGQKAAALHQAGIEISPTEQGTTTPQAIWHLNLTDNEFIDDQPIATMICGIQLETTAISSIFQNSLGLGNHYFAYAGGGGLFDSVTTSGNLQGKAFNWVGFGSHQQLIAVAFADLGNLSGSASGAIPAGTLVYCPDAKGISDGVAAGSTAVSGGNGAVLARQAGAWKVGF